MSIYNPQNKIIHYHLHGVHGVILPHSEKILTLLEVNQKIKTYTDHILNLKNKQSCRTGGAAHNRNAPIKLQLEVALANLAVLKIAKKYLTVNIPCILSCGHLANFPDAGRWINQGKSYCPLDAHLITRISPTKVEDPCITVTFEEIHGMQFYATLQTPVSAIADTGAVCIFASNTAHCSKTPSLALIPDAHLASGKTEGDTQRTAIEFLHIKSSSPSSPFQSDYGKFSTTSPTTLETIGVCPKDSLHIRFLYRREVVV